MTDYDDLNKLNLEDDDASIHSEESEESKDEVEEKVKTFTFKSMPEKKEAITEIVKESFNYLPKWKTVVYDIIILFILIILFCNVVTDTLLYKTKILKGEMPRLIVKTLLIVVSFIIIKKIIF